MKVTLTKLEEVLATHPKAIKKHYTGVLTESQRQTMADIYKDAGIIPVNVHSRNAKRKFNAFRKEFE